ncbi:hypothetical protein F5Y17DRAFT_471387 [Xylariaceae sp. FL0594]|nr:hypothetical protein F5Y17DRAFT_471387 [Xylariaceae sp. FL0594]
MSTLTATKPSAELISLFNEFLLDDSQLAFLVTMVIKEMPGKKSDPVLTHLATIPRSAPDFFDDLEQLQPYLNPDEPLFVFLRRHRGEKSPIVFANYISDTAGGRRKFAHSTAKDNLAKDFGQEHIRQTYQINSVTDLTPAGFRSIESYHGQRAPLTEREMEQEAVRKQVDETQASTNRHTGMGSRVEKKFAASATKALKRFAQSETRHLMLALTEGGETFCVSESSEPMSLADGIDAISREERRYTFFRWRPSQEELQTHETLQDRDFVLFFFTRPAKGPDSRSLVYLYAAQKENVVNEATIAHNIEVDFREETDDPTEIKEVDVLKALERLGPKANKLAHAESGTGSGTEGEPETEMQGGLNPIPNLRGSSSTRRGMATKHRQQRQGPGR